jgi:hypothetical protein
MNSKLKKLINCHPLALGFVLEAVSRYADDVAASKPEDYPPHSFIAPEAWIDLGKNMQALLSAGDSK